MTAEYYARKAAEYAATCTTAENRRRRQNGRQPNVTCCQFTTREAAELYQRGPQARLIPQA